MTHDDWKKCGNILDLPEAEITKGIQFNPDVEYDFEITEVIATKRKTVRDGHEREFTVIDAHCSEATQDASLKMSFFYNDKVTIDEENKKRESPVVKFARGVGYPAVALGKKIKFGEIIRPGISFKAHTRYQKDPKTGLDSVYSEIDFDTIRAGKKGIKMQSKIAEQIDPATEAELKALASSYMKIAEQIDPATEAELKALASGYMKFEHLVQGLVAMAKSNLITPASILNQEGKLNYKQA